ncbi:amino acid dehydrogenase [Candidatus Kaiserbacteria bacterium]|nr:amino acid dehydrogenase [Candidatus Kaiserbacteria bacterium]
MKDAAAFPEFDKHAHIETIRSGTGETIGFVAFHRQNGTVPSFGATRLWHYASSDDALRDALRLSRIMSYKAALAGLPCGGAKATIIDTSGSEDARRALVDEYAKGIAALSGTFVTGTDVGLRQEDLSLMRAQGAPVVGFSGNSTPCSVLGIYQGIICALRDRLNDDDIEGKTFAIQGLGKIGMSLLEKLYDDAAGLYVSDVDESKIADAMRRFPKVVPVAAEDIHRQPVDVFAPCALGSVITMDNVPDMRCAIIAGGANDVLGSPEAGDMLFERDILYAPDYIINAGGLIAVYDEYEHADRDDDRVNEKVTMIQDRLGDIFAESRLQRRPTNRIAQEHAEGIFGAYGPVSV